MINGYHGKLNGEVVWAGEAKISGAPELANLHYCLELKYISLVGLIKNQKAKYGANELENLDKILEKESEEAIKKPKIGDHYEHKHRL